jgi:hypothetical protein
MLTRQNFCESVRSYALIVRHFQSERILPTLDRRDGYPTLLNFHSLSERIRTYQNVP